MVADLSINQQVTKVNAAKYINRNAVSMTVEYFVLTCLHKCQEVVISTPCCHFLFPCPYSTPWMLGNEDHYNLINFVCRVMIVLDSCMQNACKDTRSEDGYRQSYSKVFYGI